MSRRCVLPLWRRVSSFILSTAFAVTAVAFSAATAQAQKSDPSDSFASSASGTVAEDAMPAAPAPAAGGGQNGNYGYHDHANWAGHLTFEAGGGFNGPLGDSSNDITWGGQFTVGAGYRFTPHISALIEYQFIDDKLPGRLIGETGATGGDAHIWSFGIAPVIDLFPKSANDIYVTGGGGFYRKVTNFTDPVLAEYCYYFCEEGYENQVVGHFSSNQGGWNIGGGYTHRLGGMYGDSKTKLFAEVRYLQVLSPASAVAPNGLGVAAVGEHTNLLPVTFGVRF